MSALWNIILGIVSCFLCTNEYIRSCGMVNYDRGWKWIASSSVKIKNETGSFNIVALLEKINCNVPWLRDRTKSLEVFRIIFPPKYGAILIPIPLSEAERSNANILRFHRVALQFLSRRVGPACSKFVRKREKKRGREKVKKKREGEKKTQTRAYTQGKERENWLATTNPFSKPLRTGTPASRSETVAVWPMNFNARPDNNKGAFIGQFLAGWLGRPSGSSAVQTAG